MNEYEEALFEGIWYKWSCLECLAMNEDENDIRNTEQECDSCGVSQRVGS